MISLIPIIIGSIIYFRLNKFYQFTILSLAALLPFSFGDFMSIPGLLLVEWLTFIAFLILMNELIPLNSIEKKIRIIKFKGIEIFIFAILVLAIWTIISFINHELLYQPIKQTGTRIGASRIYFNVFNNIILFFLIVIFTAVYFEKINFEKFFNLLVIFSSVLGVITIISYFVGFNVPLIKGTFSYLTEFSKGRISEYGGQAYRFGGMAETVTVGIPSLFACYIIKKKMNIFLFLLLLFFVFMSGGRTLMIGVIFSIMFISFLFFPRNLVYFMFVGGLIIIFGAIFLPQSVLDGQLGRLTSLNAGHFMGQDAWRGLAWKLYLDNFYDSPILGKGIMAYKGFFYSSEEGAREFALSQLFAGGHGSYLSLLSTFGLGGITYFLIMIIGGIFLSFRKIKQNLNIDVNKTAIAVFCFMLITIKSIDFITGGDGLKDAVILFYAVGLVASITTLQNRKDLNLN